MCIRDRLPLAVRPSRADSAHAPSAPCAGVGRGRAAGPAPRAHRRAARVPGRSLASGARLGPAGAADCDQRGELRRGHARPRQDREHARSEAAVPRRGLPPASSGESGAARSIAATNAPHAGGHQRGGHQCGNRRVGRAGTCCDCQRSGGRAGGEEPRRYHP